MPAWLLSLIPSLINALFGAVNTVAKDQGKTPGQAVLDVIEHLTPGMPNAPALGPKPTIDPPTDAAQ
jgi:hypothetical protein